MVEIQSRDQMLIYPEVAAAVDSLLRGEEPMAELRQRDADGQITSERVGRTPHDLGDNVQPYSRRPSNGRDRDSGRRDGRERGGRERGPGGTIVTGGNGSGLAAPAQPRVGAQRIFPFGVSRDRLERAINNLHVPATIVREMSEATMVMTLKNYYRQGAERVRQAEGRGVPVYVLRNNTLTQMERQLADIFQVSVDEVGGDDEAPEDESHARLETEEAISQLLNGERQSVDLAPRSNYVRKLQHQMAERYNVRSQSHGREPRRRVKIFR